MVFDDPPCNNYEVPLYFLRKVYCEFVLNVRPDYFDMREFHGRGGGFAQDRLVGYRRVASESRLLLAPKPKVHRSVPIELKESMDLQTLMAATIFIGAIIQHGTLLAHHIVLNDEPLVVPGGDREPIQDFCVSCSGICSGIDDAAGTDGSTSHPCTICMSRCQDRTTSNFVLTDELMDMVFAHQ